MSYCRFSSDNWRSDVYVYEDGAGAYVVNVAANRLILPPVPMAPVRWLLTGWFPMWTFTLVHRLHTLSVRHIPRRLILGPVDGQTMRAGDAMECACLLHSLRLQGYRVPQAAIDALLTEYATDTARLATTT